MPAKILSGTLASRSLLDALRNQIASRKHTALPQLVVVQVGNNAASDSYIRMKQKKAEFVGIQSIVERFPEDISEKKLFDAVKKLSDDATIHGIIVQLPLPSHINPKHILSAIDPNKDVDGFTKDQIANLFLDEDGLRSCTPQGIMNLLDFYDIDIVGKDITIIGRSNIVGKPLSLLMMNAGATVSVCHSRTKDITKYAKNADIIVVAVGNPYFFKKEMASRKATIIDVGSSFVDGKFCGDVDFEHLKDIVTAITPAPGGVGPMTVCTLLQNTWKAYQILES